MASNCIKRFPKYLVIRKMKIKTTMRFYYTIFRMTNYKQKQREKNLTIPSASKYMKLLKFSHFAGRNE